LGLNKTGKTPGRRDEEMTTDQSWVTNGSPEPDPDNTSGGDEYRTDRGFDEFDYTPHTDRPFS
jgi:hypothetical protein